ncbi:MAG: hydrogenase 4 subunit F [Raoultibacter sp.]
MDYPTMIVAAMAIPLLAFVVMIALPARHVPKQLFEAIHILSVTAVLVLVLLSVLHVVGSGESVNALGLWFHLDDLGSIFAALIGVIGFLTGVFSVPYIRHDEAAGNFSRSQIKQYYAFFSLFICTMLLVVLSNNIIMMWVSIEATTLATVFLVAVYNTKFSLEAAWKYIIVCTTGVAFGLYGTLLVYANAADIMADPHQAVFWSSLIPYASEFDGMLMQIAFVFAAIGFGTKAGLFPMHTWLPDAHSEGPSSVSGLLSGVLTKCAILVLIRFYVIAIQAIGIEFPQMIMLILGGLSVLVSALAMLSQNNLKRKLAYSTCENIGVIALCLGFGGPLGIAAALLHCIFHSLTKSLMFCLSGNVLMKYGTSDLRKIQGIIQVAPVTAVLLCVGLFALSAFPPFAMFLSEVMAFIAGISAGYLWLVVLMGLALTVVIATFALVVLRSVLGKAPDSIKKGDVGIAVLAPELVLVALVLWFGVAPPPLVLSGVESATAIVLQQKADDLHEAPVFKTFFAATNTDPSVSE